MSLALELFSRNDKPSYRITLGRKHDSTAAYEIITTDLEEARAFLLTYVKDARVKVELTVTAGGEDVYRFLGATPPGWTPPSGT
jgi:hypothetical protein